MISEKLAATDKQYQVHDLPDNNVWWKKIYYDFTYKLGFRLKLNVTYLWKFQDAMTKLMAFDTQKGDLDSFFQELFASES